VPCLAAGTLQQVSAALGHLVTLSILKVPKKGLHASLLHCTLGASIAEHLKKHSQIAER
jgi:hypothetical protein